MITSKQQDAEWEAFNLINQEAFAALENDLANIEASLNSASQLLAEANLAFGKAKKTLLEPKSKKNTVNCARHLDHARKMALRYLFRTELSKLLMLNGLHTGYHKFESKEQGRPHKQRVSSLWAVDILPSFDSPALLAVVSIEQEHYGAFGTAIGDIGLNITCHVARLDQFWTDNVSQLLSQFNLYENNKSLSLDGIGYHMRIDTFSLKADLAFSNPMTQTLMGLENALIKIGENIANNSHDDRLMGFLKIWHKYTDARLTDGLSKR